MSVSKINFNDRQEAYILVEPISEIDRSDFKTYLDLDSPSFLPCEFENDKAFTLYYKYGNRRTLKQFLSRVVRKTEAIAFLKSLTRVYMDAEENHLKTEHILLGINSVFYDEEAQQVSCIYVPVADGVLPVRPLRLFVKEMLVNTVYSDDDDMTWLGNVIRYIGRNRNFSYSDFYEFLQTQEETAEETGMNGEAEWELETVDAVPETPETAEASETAEETVEEAEEETETGHEDAEPENTGEDDGLEDLKSVLESIPAAESVSALKTDISEIHMTSEDVKLPEETAVEVETEAEMKTEEADEAVESSESPLPEGWLLRCSDHEMYALNQPAIRIGKSSEAEICIGDNPAVSRIHAVVTCQKDGFAIRDNASTNHTFVNGILLKADQEKVLTPGDRILLGNEEFVFKM